MATKNPARIMPRIDGPSEAKRRVLANAAQSILLYGVEIWGTVLEVAKYKEMANRFQRKLALKISCGYRTISTEAAAVIARLVPLHLIAIERKAKKTKENRIRTIQRWQKEWSEYRNENWTRALIPDVEPWYMRNFGSVNFHLTQILTGHGCFEAYLCKIKKRSSPVCIFCETNVDDTAEHTIFSCVHWKKEREDAENKTGVKISKENLVKLMLVSEENWDCISNLATCIMKEKERVERENEIKGQSVIV